MWRGEDTAWLEQVLAELEPLTEQTHDLQSTHAIHGAFERHGPGSYPAEELAALAGHADIDGVRRMLKQMLAAGLATYLRPRRRTIAAELTVLGARFPTRVLRSDRARRPRLWSVPV